MRRALPLVALLIIVGSISYGLGWSNLFQVKVVAITGTTHTAQIDQKLATAGISLHMGERMARVDVKAVDRVISGIDWISKVKVSRNWLSGKVGIALMEKSAVAGFAATDGTMQYFDAAGNIFHSPDSLSTLPTISFANQDQAARQAAASLIASLPSDVRASLVNLRVTSPQTLVMTSSLITPSLEITWGDSSQIDIKVKVLRALLDLPENKKVRAIDLSQPSNPTAK
jgi:cell division septal protein FtsQ